MSAGWVSDDVDLYRDILPQTTKGLRGLNALFRGRSPLSSGKQTPLPVFMSGVPEVDSCDDKLIAGALQLVQREGDLVMIPPRWWHQVYHLQPSVAVAGQYVNHHTFRGMQEHMFSWCGGGSHQVNYSDFDKLSIREKVRLTIRKALELNYGSFEGAEMAKKLLEAD